MFGKESHPWINLPPKEFLEKIGGIKKDRKTGKIWLTFAGLIMFGKMQSIKDYIPNFHLDYFDNSTLESERWVDRVTLDGSWGEGNIFNFFFAVINKLYLGLKVPFEILEDGYTRRENTLAHTALREAFVNTIIHADYKGEAALKIIKYSDRYEFFNPGLLRISKEELFKGGNSYPRNPVLMSMFQYINIGERAGSGFPKILAAAKEYNWKLPEIIENPKLDFVQIVIWDETLRKQDSLIAKKEQVEREMEEIAKIIKENNSVKNLFIQEKLQISKSKSNRLLNEMIERKIIKKLGTGKNTIYELES